MLDVPAHFVILRNLSPSYITTTPHVTTDASGWGIGGFVYYPEDDTHYYFSIRWRYGLENRLHSTYGELYALVVCAALWDRVWSRHHIRWSTDCIAHVTGLYKIRTQAPELLPLHDYLDLRQARGQYVYAAKHLAGSKNVIADNLSRGVIEVPSDWVRCHLDMDQLPMSFGEKLCW